MSHLWQIVKAEVKKQHRNTFHSTAIYFSLLVWPVLTFTNTYFSYKPFAFLGHKVLGMASAKELMTFLILGFFGYLAFKSLMQSAWQMSYERQNGTLETVFLSPANRLAMMYGRSLGALIENVWMFFVFAAFLLLVIQGIPLERVVFIPICFIILMGTAVIWGGLLNAVFLFSRDSSILFMIFDDPMVLFAGVRIPVALFPAWAKLISLFFPLTYVLMMMRALLMGNSEDIWMDVVGIFAVNVIMVVLTVYVLKKAERHARNTGNLTLY